MAVLESFSIRLKMLRKEKGLTQEELSMEFGISRTCLSYYEKGSRTPNIEILSKASEYFKVSVDYLLGYSAGRSYEESMMLDELSNRVLEHYGYNKEEINPNIKIGTGCIREQLPLEILGKISQCQGMLENERFRFIVEYDPEYEHFLTLVDYPLRYVQPSGNDKQSTDDGESRKA